MCQLLGMNCNVPTDICFSFEGFHRRGGSTDHHADGWGIAFFEGRGCRLFIDSKSAVESPIAELVRNYPIHSMNVIAHIRKATLRSRIPIPSCVSSGAATGFSRTTEHSIIFRHRSKAITGRWEIPTAN